MAELEPIQLIELSDPRKRKVSRRFEQGAVVSSAGGHVTVDVGATLADGTPVEMEMPAAKGFSPAVGEMVKVQYPYNGVRGAVAIGTGQAAAVVPGISSHSLSQHTDASALTGILKAAAGVFSAIAAGTANQVLGMNAAASGYEYKTILGTANRVTVSHGANAITLSGPQDIHTGASPTFAGLTTSGATLLGDATTADVELFGTGTVADAADGKKFIIHRKAAEFNRNLQIYINEAGTTNFTVSAGAMAFSAVTTNNFYAPSGTRFGRNWASGQNDTFDFYGWVTAAAATKYARFQLTSTGVFSLSPQDANVTKLAVGMDLDITGNIVVSGTVDTVDIAAHAANVTTHGDWPAGLDVTELGYLNGVTSAIQTQIDAKADSVVREEHITLMATTESSTGSAALGARFRIWWDPAAWVGVTSVKLAGRTYVSTGTGGVSLYTAAGVLITGSAISTTVTVDDLTAWQFSGDFKANMPGTAQWVQLYRNAPGGGTVYYGPIFLIISMQD